MPKTEVAFGQIRVGLSTDRDLTGTRELEIDASDALKSSSDQTCFGQNSRPRVELSDPGEGRRSGSM